MIQDPRPLSERCAISVGRPPWTLDAFEYEARHTQCRFLPQRKSSPRTRICALHRRLLRKGLRYYIRRRDGSGCQLAAWPGKKLTRREAVRRASQRANSRRVLRHMQEWEMWGERQKPLCESCGASCEREHAHAGFWFCSAVCVRKFGWDAFLSYRRRTLHKS